MNNWFKRHSFEWQTSWRNWGLSIYDVDYSYPTCENVWKRYVIVGPLQMRWWK